jgi:hypothetical protein
VELQEKAENRRKSKVSQLTKGLTELPCFLFFYRKLIGVLKTQFQLQFLLNKNPWKITP